jgi:hypothetical protein
MPQWYTNLGKEELTWKRELWQEVRSVYTGLITQEGSRSEGAQTTWTRVGY